MSALVEEASPAAPGMAQGETAAHAASFARGGFAGSLTALSVPNFRFFTASSVFLSAAMNMQQLANGWYAYHLTGSTAILGLTLLAQAIPQTVLSIFGGVLSDRLPRRYLMMTAFTGYSLLAFWIALSILLDTITWQDLVVRAFLFGCILSFSMPARQGIIGELVGRERIMSAVSISQAIQNISQFAGPAIAGFAIAWISIQGAYWLIGGSFLMAGVCMLPVRYTARRMPSKAGVKGFLANIPEGLKYIRGNQDVFLLLLFTLATTFFATPYTQLLPVFTTDVLHVGPEKLGLLSSISGIGALLGSVIVSWMGAGKRGTFFIYSALTTGTALIVFCLTTSYAASACIILLIGAGQSIRMTMSSGLLQSYTEDRFVGRVLSIQMMQNGLTSIGAFAVALFAGLIGVRWALGMTAVLLLVTSIAFLAASPRLRKLA